MVEREIPVSYTHLDVYQRQVTIRGTAIRDVPLAELMEQISMVFQRVYLFQDTIYNLSLIHI